MLVVVLFFCGYGVVIVFVKWVIDVMVNCKVDEIVFEIEEINEFVMCFYECFGFLRFKKLYWYYLNGNSVYRFVLLLRFVDLDVVFDGYDGIVVWI